MLGGASLACDQLQPGPRGVVAAVIDGDTFLLADGAKVRLIGIQAPKLSQGRDGTADWPFADAARDALSRLVKGREIELRYGQTAKDRYGRLLAHAFVAETGLWVEEEMLRLGLARVYSLADNRLCLEELYRTEAQARAERAGLWSEGYYAIRSAGQPERLAGLSGHFELVEGAVQSVGHAGGRTYLNFGTDFSRDFTVVIEADGLRLFEAAGIDPQELDGALIRVRGWIDLYGGPRIMVTHPEQIEVLAQ
ncbi:MAG: thermonuclease family protein [Hyphomicrobiaceae bacterium]|nr:thermonuclease family protein [Hyphomicrobiaceae bacterium]